MRYLLLTTLLLLALTGCTSTLMPQNTIVEGGITLGNHYLTKPERQAQLNAIRNWTAGGSIAAHNDTQGLNAYYHWQQKGDHYELVMFGPLGVGHTQLSGEPGRVTLTTPSQQTYTAANAETLLLERTGWHLPVSDLYYWLRGLPLPHARFRGYFDPNNHLVNMYQDGWRLMYLRYVSVNGIDLPGRILLTNRDWRVQIVITQWQLN
jgi:outer membrane lipoprotein LolB